MEYNTRVTINREESASYDKMKKELLMPIEERDPLLFCPVVGMIIRADFNQIEKKFMIDIYCVNPEMAESAIMHNDWLKVRNKEDGIYFDIFNHRCFITSESDEVKVTYEGKHLTPTIKNKMGENKHYYNIHLTIGNPYNIISKIKRA